MPLWARDGDGDRALACLEHGIATIAPPDDVLPHAAYAFRRAYFSNVDIRRFFPADTTDWADPVGWFLAAAERIRSWIETDRIDEEEIRAALEEFDGIWGQLVVREKQRILQLLIETIHYDGERGEVAIEYRPAGIRALGAKG